MKRTFPMLGILLAALLPALHAAGQRDGESGTRGEPIKAFCVDFNWGPGGPNGFAKPGLWADADPARHVAWYAELGCNVIQTFAVSCNGYAWYRHGVVPEQPGLQHDFLPEVVRLGHAKHMRVMGYFCIGANTRWGQQHPDLSYGFPSAYHIPFTDAYLDYLADAIADAVRTTGMDGFMIDWVWCPSDKARQQATGGKWLEAETKLYQQLLGRPFPGEDKLTPEDKLAYERKAISRCWSRIRAAAKRANPSCVIWLSCNKVKDPAIADSPMLKEVDWVMDESGTPAAMREVAPMFGPRTRQLLCLAGWGDRHKTREILSDPAMAAYGIYGFARPTQESLFPPVRHFLSRPIEAFHGNDRGISALARYFTGKPFDFVAPPDASTAAGWQKFAGNPVLGGKLGTCFDVALLREDAGFRMWFSWRPKKSVALTESPDGIHWSEPVIALGPNPASGWENDLNRPVVVKRGDGYHLWFTGQVKGGSRIGYATSPDGRRWRRVTGQPVLSPEAPWEKAAIMCPHVIWDEDAKQFRMWYSGGEQYEPNAIGYATSSDGVTWTKSSANPIFAADPKSEWERHKVTACQVVRHGGWYVMFYIGFRDEHCAQIGIARSRDGITGWQRLPANPIIRPTPDAWDASACYKPFAILDGNRWLLWYNGRKDRVEQIGLATHEGAGLGFSD